jgi:hypothetical protein
MYNKMKKSIIINEEIHTQLKKYCDENGLKLQKLVENLIIKHIQNGRKEMDKTMPSM